VEPSDRRPSSSDPTHPPPNYSGALLSTDSQKSRSSEPLIDEFQLHRITSHLLGPPVEWISQDNIDDKFRPSKYGFTGTGQQTEEGSSKRLHDRISINCQLNLCWQDNHESRVLPGRAINLSKFGMMVLTDRAIVAGTIISVQTNSTMLGRACVRHCTPEGLKYKIGLHIPSHSVYNRIALLVGSV
jgi:hypothetical protein